MKRCFYKAGFTLAEVLLAILIVGIISALVLPILIHKYQNSGFDKAYDREVLALQNAVDSLAVSEQKATFFDTMMYEGSAAEFMKKYLKLARYCGDANGECFAPKYYEYKENKKAEYTPTYQGACAQLKNGMSLCLSPQTATTPVKGIIDLNGPKGPNVVGRDLRVFSLKPQSKREMSYNTDDVLALDLPPADSNYDDPPTPPPTPPTPSCALPDPVDPSRCCESTTINGLMDTCCQAYRDHIPACAFTPSPHPPGGTCEQAKINYEINDPSHSCCSKPEFKDYIGCKPDVVLRYRTVKHFPSPSYGGPINPSPDALSGFEAHFTTSSSDFNPTLSISYRLNSFGGDFGCQPYDRSATISPVYSQSADPMQARPTTVSTSCQYRDSRGYLQSMTPESSSFRCYLNLPQGPGQSSFRTMVPCWKFNATIRFDAHGVRQPQVTERF